MSVRRAMVVVGLVTAAWCAIGVPAEATYGARTTADEPQYLLTALSLGEDVDLDISDELRERRWLDFHRALLPEQTKPLDGDQRLSPHDPLLPAVLAVPMRVAGWAAAKATLSLLAGLLAAATMWLAVVRFDVPTKTAALTVLAFSLAAPLASYGSQVYPELPAALAVVLATIAVTGALDRRGLVVAGLAITALPWLAVKYAPVAAVLAAIAVVRVARRGAAGRVPALAFVGGLALSGVVYLALHRAWYHGWTVYAAGDHFVGGEFSVAGVSPDYVGRSRRLVGLFVDKHFGLAAWAPVWLLAVPALGGLVRRRPEGWHSIVWPALAGWLTATFVALTMHGYWWPGRQTVVILPLLVVAVAWWAAQVRGVVTAVAVAGVAGIVTWAWLLADVFADRVRLVIDFERTTNPLVRAWRVALPDERTLDATASTLHAIWVAAVVVLAVAGWRSVRTNTNRRITDVSSPPPRDRAGRRDAVVLGRSVR